MRQLHRSLAVLTASASGFAGFAQEVIAASGAGFGNGSLSIAFTIGEPVIATDNAPGLFLTQGFHQPPDDFSTNVADVMHPGVEVIAFPNPAREEVTIRVDGNDGPLSVEVFDAAGRAVLPRTSFTGSTRLAAAALASGTYHARITALDTYLTTVQLSITR
ncbi:MAG: T9SS type A sorting domain-containing protein [Flavobacteriales bacterium]|nr:T9SS type A sorting domain-containing protein [Flavobacteriales bacterium]